MISSLHDALHSWLASNGGGLRDHLFFSTLLLLALLAASSLPLLRPRTRYALLFLGVARFLLPGAFLSGLLATLTRHAVELPSFSMTLTSRAPFSTTPQSETSCLLAALWLAGALAVAMPFALAHLHWRRTVRAAGPASERENAAMRRLAPLSALRRAPRLARTAAPVPLTAGFLRPVILLPETCSALEDGELDAVLAHELAHVERRHNLGGLVQSVAAVLFWFDPALWMARVRLHAEAEKDCDERVLSFVPDPPTYVSGMLKVSRGFIAPRPAGVSCMSTSRLKERMDHLMTHHESRTRPVPHRLAFAAGVAALALTTVFVSAGTPPAAAPPDPAVKQAAGETAPKLVSSVQPVYPESAREKRVEGLVIVQTSIDRKGNVTAVSIARGIDGPEGKALEESALAAVRQWKFAPATKNGKPVAVSYKVTVNFKLE